MSTYADMMTPVVDTTVVLIEADQGHRGEGGGNDSRRSPRLDARGPGDVDKVDRFRGLGQRHLRCD